MERNLRYDMPASQGEKNVLRRIQQLLHVRWAPLHEYRENDREYIWPVREGENRNSAAGYTGIPYSSCRVEDKFVGLDILPVTFFSALNNPASVMYTRDLSDFHDPAYNCAINNAFLYYGTVCSAFANYALDLPLHRCTHEWDQASEFYRVEDQSACGLKLCDTLLTTRKDGRTGGHVRIVSGIARSEDGCVVRVQISEGMQPFPECKWYSAEEFAQTLSDPEKRYQIFRYRHLDRVTYRDIPECKAEDYALLPDLGDCANYREGDCVHLNLLTDADAVILTCENEERRIKTAGIPKTGILGDAYTIISIENLSAGLYTAYAEKDKSPSKPVSFQVVKVPDISVEDVNGNAFPLVELEAVTPQGTPLEADSACLLDDSGNYRSDTVQIAFSDGSTVFPARAAVRWHDGKCVVKPAALLWDLEKRPVSAFCVGESRKFYVYRAKSGTPCTVRFAGAVCAAPYFLSWKEEAAIAYLQRELTEEEKKNGKAETTILWHDNPFSRFTVFSRNAFGRMAAEYIPFLVERE